MPRLSYALLCTDVIVDKDSNAVSYIRVAEVIHFARLPGRVPPLVVALAFERAPGDDAGFGLRLSLVAPDGKVSPMVGFSVPAAPGPNQRLSLRLAGMAVEGVGRHAVLVERAEGGGHVPLAELPLHVVLREGPRPQGGLQEPEGPVQ